MKKMTAILLFLLITTMGVAQNNLKSRKIARIEKQTQLETKVDSMVNSGHYTVQAQSAQPMGWQQVSLSSGYELKIKGDSTFAYLPYYGRVYFASFNSNEGGIRFGNQIKNYKVNKDRNNTEVSFNVGTQDDVYQVNMSISKSGYASIVINSNNRQSISYYGLLNQLSQ